MPRILWMSPFSLHDTSSGAAVNCRHMLKSLYDRGFEVWACSSFIFDAKNGAQAFGNLKKLLDEDDHDVFAFDEDGIHYVYTRTEGTDEADMTLMECQLFYRTFCSCMSSFKPDVVIGFGNSPLAMNCFAEARSRSISTAYMLSNGTWSTYLFPNIDLILTDSYANARLYAERDEINTVPVGAFFDLKSIVAAEHQKRFVTMVNPSDYKGVSIFARLAEICRKRMPEVQFLTVNTHERFTEVVTRLHTKGNPAEHPYHQDDFPNVFMVEQQVDMRSIYAISSVMLVPSLWFEAWGRTASEAVFNNIPVIAANTGGLAEAIAGGGVLLETPEHCRDDYMSLPDDEEMEPWLNTLEVLLRENFDAELEAARARLSQENAVNRLIEALQPLIERTTAARSPGNSMVSSLNALSNDELTDISFE